MEREQSLMVLLHCPVFREQAALLFRRVARETECSPPSFSRFPSERRWEGTDGERGEWEGARKSYSYKKGNTVLQRYTVKLL